MKRWKRRITRQAYRIDEESFDVNQKVDAATHQCLVPPIKPPDTQSMGGTKWLNGLGGTKWFDDKKVARRSPPLI